MSINTFEELLIILKAFITKQDLINCEQPDIVYEPLERLARLSNWHSCGLHDDCSLEDLQCRDVERYGSKKIQVTIKFIYWSK